MTCERILEFMHLTIRQLLQNKFYVIHIKLTYLLQS